MQAYALFGGGNAQLAHPQVAQASTGGQLDVLHRKGSTSGSGKTHLVDFCINDAGGKRKPQARQLIGMKRRLLRFRLPFIGQQRYVKMIELELREMQTAAP